MLLAQPCLDFTIKFDGKTPEQYALDKVKPALAGMIAQEVSGRVLPVSHCLLFFPYSFPSTLLVLAVRGSTHWSDSAKC